MRAKIIFLQLLLFSLFFTGCDLLGPSEEEIRLKEKELNQTRQMKQKEIETQLAIKEKEIALKEKELNQNQQLKQKEVEIKLEEKKAELNSKKDIEIEKIKSEIAKEKIRIEKEKIKAANREKRLQYELEALQKEQDKQIKTYAIILLAGVLLLLSLLFFVYLNNRRKDKLKAYEDNMEKYFRAKENEAKLQIANKILDTISKGDLKPETESKLIASLNGSSQTKKQPQNQITKDSNGKVMDLEVLDEEIKQEQLDKK
ncbi:hypothetical protein CP960_10440 [Malaciobacter halophilus]|uniref:Uncharacterized protein n=1 Tax=Malaciobacter halophilus TaxID=197482 RepID=A0A2N1J0Z8_9BACT|nr:hypothetical protein [Malaciobacter halophilus]AXH09452.1 putative membrane protein [Malaciobacter halophilus]PKI80237.1 hypothetical protein CP960_10440 [Malaciobacter halophilus]